MSTLEFGVRFPMFGPEADPKRFERLATTAEENGFSTIIGGDHVVFPRDIPPTHPGPEEGAPSVMHPESDAYGIFETLSFAAAVTDEIHLAPNVCIVPYRHPVVLAKNALTVAALSGGRLEFGVGAGWLDTEFEVLDVPFAERGGRLDEFLTIFGRACAEEVFSFEGEFHSFPETGFHPVPDEQPTMWIGGHSGPAFRRVAEFGDGWTVSRQTPGELAAARKRIMNAWTDHNREGEPGVAIREYLHIESGASAEDERKLVGSADDVIEDLRAYADAGATRFDVTFDSPDLETQLAQLERIGEDVVPAF
ncbi:MAG: TIGR03619 family F420-dependent LLM class oxidoreductase [Salinirussus sp.]